MDRAGEQIEQIAPSEGGPPLKKKKQNDQFTYWFFTFNGYKDGDMEHLEQEFKLICDWYVFQEEIGDGTHDVPEGTPHLQGTLKLKKRQRMTELKPIEPKIAWFKTISVKGSKCYCSKQKSRNGKQCVFGIELFDPVEVVEPTGWQLDVMKIVDDKETDRKIHWFWEPTGGVGKTELCKYLMVMRDASFVGGKKADILHSIMKKTPKVVIVNIPRAEYGFVNYGALESTKDGCIFSGKYEGGAKAFNKPKIICFANSPPDLNMLSADRWNIVNVKELIDAITPA